MGHKVADSSVRKVVAEVTGGGPVGGRIAITPAGAGGRIVGN